MLGRKIDFNHYRELQGLNASVIKAGVSGVYQAYHALNSSFDNSAMAFGRALHHYILERDTFDQHYALSPKFDRRTKAGKEASQAFEATLQGKQAIDGDDMDKLIAIESNLKDNAFFINAMKYCEPEMSYEWKSEDHVNMKARLDLVDETGVIIDLKTVRSADFKDVQREIISRSYDVQMLHYSKAIQDKPRLVILAIEAESAQFAIYDISDLVYSAFTADRYKRGIINSLEAMLLDRAPAKYPDHPQTMSLPIWAKEET